MGKLVFGAILLLAAFLIMTAKAAIKGQGPSTAGSVLRAIALAFTVLGAVLVVGSTIAVIGAGQVGVRHAFGKVDETPLLPGIRFVTPWSSVERFSTREEQFPEHGDRVEEIAAPSSEQMGMTIDVALRWQINPQEAPQIFREIGTVMEAEVDSALVARLQSDQQRLLNQTLTPEALTKQYLEVLHDMRQSNNLVVLVPTEGGMPLLDLGALRRNLQQR